MREDAEPWLNHDDSDALHRLRQAERINSELRTRQGDRVTARCGELDFRFSCRTPAAPRFIVNSIRHQQSSYLLMTGSLSECISALRHRVLRSLVE